MAGYNVPTYGAFSQIGGALPFNGNSVSGFASGNPGEIAANYQQAYNNALGMNSANYSNILAGYQRALASQTTAQQAIQAGYSNLYNDVLAKVSGIGQARAMEINDSAARNLAAGSQQLIDRGLGNTTIQSSVNRGVEGDRARRQIENDESIASLMGNYMSQLGLSGLRSTEQGVNNLTGLNLRQLDFMNSVTAKYPDAGLYAGLAQQAGRNQGGGGGFGGGAFGGAGPRVGYVPGGWTPPGGGYYSATPTGGGDGSWLASQYAGGNGTANMYDNYYGGGGGSGIDFGSIGGGAVGGAMDASGGGGGFWGQAAQDVASGSLYGYDNPGNDSGGGGDSSWFDW